MDTKILLNKLLDKKNLNQRELGYLLDQIVGGFMNPSEVAAFLVGLRVKGETVDEIAGLIKGMRGYMLKVNVKGVVVDTCGTGGDGSNTFNISTLVAFVVAGAGVQVAKHGNRAASSKCGSADVLEALGVHIMLTPQQAEKVLEKVGMVFLFAPLYHPATKNIVPIRKELGVRTVFNFLGPFLNPAGVKRQIVGVPNIAIAKKLAQVAKKLGYTHLCIVSSKDGMDEVSTTSPTHMFEVKKGRITSKVLTPQTFGIKKAVKKDLLGGTAKVNAGIITKILSGEMGSKRDIVVLNSAVVMYAAGKVKTIQEGIIMANKSIDTGSAKKVLENLVKQTKKYE